eukprot:7343834-Prymnesium_polylepis.1
MRRSEDFQTAQPRAPTRLPAGWSRRSAARAALSLPAMPLIEPNVSARASALGAGGSCCGLAFCWTAAPFAAVFAVIGSRLRIPRPPP